MWPIFRIQIKTFKLINLDFADDNTLSCIFYFFLIIDLYFLTPAVITQILNPIAKLAISIGITSKEAKLKMEMHPLTAEIKRSKWSI